MKADPTRAGMSRRALIKAGAVSTGMLGLGPLARAMPLADVAIHDSRFGGAPGLATQTIDLVEERRQRWATIRSGLGNTRRIDGVCAWSDYVMIAHELERRGFRRTAEVPQGRLWRWTLLRQNQRIERDHAPA